MLQLRHCDLIYIHIHMCEFICHKMYHSCTHKIQVPVTENCPVEALSDFKMCQTSRYLPEMERIAKCDSSHFDLICIRHGVAQLYHHRFQCCL